MFIQLLLFFLTQPPTHYIIPWFLLVVGFAVFLPRFEHFLNALIKEEPVDLRIISTLSRRYLSNVG